MGIAKQVEKICPRPGCGSKLVWQRCEAKCYWTTLETPDHNGHIATLKHKGRLNTTIFRLEVVKKKKKKKGKGEGIPSGVGYVSRLRTSVLAVKKG
jgi:hypothetical protein